MTLLSQELLRALTNEPQSKDALKDRLHISEREVRRCVAELRNLGYNVASNSHGKGYWLGNDKDKECTVREYRSRASKLMKTADALEQGPDLGQMEAEI